MNIYNLSKEDKDKILPNSKVFSIFVQPLFSRSGLVVWQHPLLYLFKNKENSHILTNSEIDVFFNKEWKYVRIFKYGFKTSPFGKPWDIDREFSKDERSLETDELQSSIIIYTTNNSKEFEIIKNLKCYEKQ